MKKTILLVTTVIMITGSVHAQLTHYGFLSGVQGTDASYFGGLAGGQATGASNTFIGCQSGHFSSGPNNVAVGFKSMHHNSSGTANVANGFEALFYNTTGSLNTANGFRALHENTIGMTNTATGAYALHGNISGQGNTADGHFALFENQNGSQNVAMGLKSLINNLSGSSNVAVGTEALLNNITGHTNVAVGSLAAHKNSRGEGNTAVGTLSLSNNTIGNDNSAFGHKAGQSNPAGLNNTTCIGAGANVLSHNQIRLGNSAVTSIGGQVNWSVLSDGRFKRNIKEDISGLDFINQLRPVSYELDKKAVKAFMRIPETESSEAEAKKPIERQSGFIAQEVEAVVKKSGYTFSGVEVPQNEGDHYSIRYAEFVVPLVKAVQELTAKFDEQKQKLQAQELEIATLKQKLSGYEGTSNITKGSHAGLFQNNPNPFSTDTEIRMTLPETTQSARVIVYTLDGKELKNIPVMDRGEASVKISGNDLSEGIYLYALVVDGKVVDTKRLVLTK